MMKEYRLVEENTLKRLIKSHLKLIALENGGVDNWGWYGDSLGDFLSKWAKNHNLDPDEDEYGFDTVVNEEIKNYKIYTK